MDISINTPALLFPAISLVMLAYTNRFLALANRVRSLHDKYNTQEQKHIIHAQIKIYAIHLRKHSMELQLILFAVLLIFVIMQHRYIF